MDIYEKNQIFFWIFFDFCSREGYFFNTLLFCALHYSSLWLTVNTARRRREKMQFCAVFKGKIVFFYWSYPLSRIAFSNYSSLWLTVNTELFWALRYSSLWLTVNTWLFCALHYSLLWLTVNSWLFWHIIILSRPLNRAAKKSALFYDMYYSELRVWLRGGE